MLLDHIKLSKGQIYGEKKSKPMTDGRLDLGLQKFDTPDLGFTKTTSV